MIILRVLGGLGNQMFQYAFARNLQLIYGDDLRLDCSRYSTYKIRDFSLNHLNIPYNIINLHDKDIKRHDKFKMMLHRNIYHIQQKILRKINTNGRLGKELYYKWSEKGCYFNFDRFYYEPLISNKELKYVFGYFQCEKYFKDNIRLIRNELKVVTVPTEKEKEILDEISRCEAVAVSIREGADYHNSNMDVCRPDFYYRGMDVIANKVKNPVFYIFSDCIDKVKNEYKFKYPVKYVENMKDYESLRLVYSCKHFVIANSSFSWWGAYLSDYKDKIVIAPNEWYKNGIKSPDIYSDFITTIDV